MCPAVWLPSLYDGTARYLLHKGDGHGGHTSHYTVARSAAPGAAKSSGHRPGNGRAAGPIVHGYRGADHLPRWRTRGTTAEAVAAAAAARLPGDRPTSRWPAQGLQ